MAVSLWNRSFISTVAELAASLHLTGTQTGDRYDALANAINWSGATMDRYCVRTLRAQNYRPILTVEGILENTGHILTLDSDEVDIVAGDPVMAEGIPIGVYVVSYTHPNVVLSDSTADIVVPQEFTIGIGRLQFDGEGSNVLRTEEKPLVTLWEVAALASDGTEEALDLTGVRIERSSGRAVLPAASLPVGDANIAISCRCGYELAGPTSSIDVTACLNLAAAQTIIARTIYQEWIDQTGNAPNQSFGPASIGISEDAIHPRAREILADYVRRG